MVRDYDENLSGQLRFVSLLPPASHCRFSREKSLQGACTAGRSAKLAARIAAMHDRLPPGRYCAQPLTAAAVRSLMKCSWKNTNSTAIGSVATVDAAIAAAH